MRDSMPDQSQSSSASIRAARSLSRLGVGSIPKGWTLSTVGTACTIRNELRLPLSVEMRAEMQGEYPYYGPTGVLDHITEFRAEGEFALIGEDGDHFLDVLRKPQTVRVSGKFNVNNHAHMIQSGTACDVDWFFPFFSKSRHLSFFDQTGRGAVQTYEAGSGRAAIIAPAAPRTAQDRRDSADLGQGARKTHRPPHGERAAFRGNSPTSARAFKSNRAPHSAVELETDIFRRGIRRAERSKHRS